MAMIMDAEDFLEIRENLMGVSARNRGQNNLDVHRSFSKKITQISNLMGYILKAYQN